MIVFYDFIECLISTLFKLILKKKKKSETILEVNAFLAESLN